MLTKTFKSLRISSLPSTYIKPVKINPRKRNSSTIGPAVTVSSWAESPRGTGPSDSFDSVTETATAENPPIPINSATGQYTQCCGGRQPTSARNRPLRHTEYPSPTHTTTTTNKRA